MTPILVDLKTAAILCGMKRAAFDTHIRPRLTVYQRPGLKKHVRYDDLIKAIEEFETDCCTPEFKTCEKTPPNIGAGVFTGGKQKAAELGISKPAHTEKLFASLVERATRAKRKNN